MSLRLGELGLQRGTPVADLIPRRSIEGWTGVAECRPYGASDRVVSPMVAPSDWGISISQHEIECREFAFGCAEKLCEILEALSMPEARDLAPIGDRPELPLPLKDADIRGGCAGPRYFGGGLGRRRYLRGREQVTHAEPVH